MIVFFVLQILVWCLLGYYGGLLFAKKGYPPTLGIIIGILFGPIALILVLILPGTREARERAIEEKQLAIEQADCNRTKVCPQCKRESSIAAPVCPRCEFRFELDTLR